jgi:hypothetical protein
MGLYPRSIRRARNPRWTPMGREMGAVMRAMRKFGEKHPEFGKAPASAQSARRDGAAAPPHSQTRWPATLWHSGGLIWLHVWSVSQALSATQNDVPAGQEFGAHRCRPVS